MVVIITGMMVIEQIKNKIKSILDTDKKKVIKYFYIAMITIFVIIAIILIDLIRKNSKENNGNVSVNVYSKIEFYESNDVLINNFITNYFKARHTLNYSKIFSSFGRDYYREKRKDKTGEVKKIVDSIRYEKTFVRDYDNIKVYKAPGYYDEDVVCVVTYDLLLGFSDDSAPMIIIFYLEKKGESYIIKENLDIGTSKYLMACMNAPEINALYEDVKARLTRSLVSSEALKLSYNSLRQFEMNMSGELNYDRVNILENYGLKEFNPVEDMDKIYEYIKNEKRIEENKAKLDAYLSKLIASVSEVE